MHLPSLIFFFQGSGEYLPMDSLVAPDVLEEGDLNCLCPEEVEEKGIRGEVSQ